MRDLCGSGRIFGMGGDGSLSVSLDKARLWPAYPPTCDVHGRDLRSRPSG